MKRDHRRKKYLIDKKFQLRVFSKFLLMVTFAAVLTSSIVYLYSYKQEKISSTSLYYVTADFNEDPKIVKQTDIILPALIISEGITIFITAIFVLFYSHKMAGPVYRFKKITEEISRGNLDIEVKLRKRDEFSDLAESFNIMIRQLKER